MIEYVDCDDDGYQLLLIMRDVIMRDARLVFFCMRVFVVVLSFS